MLSLSFHLLTLLAGSTAFAPSFAQNVTVQHNSSSIQYTAGAANNLSPCQVDANGDLIPGQPGCYLTTPGNCSSGAAMMTGIGNGASFSFKGSAIYIDALLDDTSALYTVTLDGNSTDVDGVRNTGPFFCTPLFSQSGLDPTAQHEINVTIKGASPHANLTDGPDSDPFLWITDFTFTEPDGNSTSSTSSGKTSASTTGSSTGSASSPASTSSAYLSSPFLPTYFLATFLGFVSWLLLL